jgi:hypothetical protein
VGGNAFLFLLYASKTEYFVDVLSSKQAWDWLQIAGRASRWKPLAWCSPMVARTRRGSQSSMASARICGKGVMKLLPRVILRRSFVVRRPRWSFGDHSLLLCWRLFLSTGDSRPTTTSRLDANSKVPELQRGKLMAPHPKWSCPPRWVAWPCCEAC